MPETSVESHPSPWRNPPSASVSTRPSLYEVSGLVPGESMLLRDLIRAGAPIRVLKHSGSPRLKP